jgi:cytochrome c-type biogenesis protein CcmH
MRRLVWALLAVVVAGALWYGTTDRDERTASERADDIAADLRCPFCRSESVRDSQADVAQNMRAEIARRIADGESDDEIVDALVASYGETIVMTPSGSGTASLVWVLPVAALVGGLAALAFAFRRWRST